MSLSPQEFAALSAVAQARKQNLANLLGTANVRFGKHAKTDAANKTVKESRKVRKSLIKLLGDQTPEVGAGQVANTGEDFVRTTTGGMSTADLAEVIGAGAAAEFAREMAPAFGALYSVYKAGKSWKEVIKDALDLHRIPDYKQGVIQGDPLQAADAVERLLERKLAYDSGQAGRQSAAAGAKIAGLFTDLGVTTTAALGLANALAGLAMEVAAIGVEYTDMSAGNKRLGQAQTLDATVFRDCPVLGAYLLVCSDTSAVANFFVADIGLPGWMDKVERLKKEKLDPLIKLSNKVIQNSRLTVEGIPTTKGLTTKKLSAWQQFKRLVKNQVS